MAWVFTNGWGHEQGTMAWCEDLTLITTITRVSNHPKREWSSNYHSKGSWKGMKLFLPWWYCKNIIAATMNWIQGKRRHGRWAPPTFFLKGQQIEPWPSSSYGVILAWPCNGVARPIFVAARAGKRRRHTGERKETLETGSIDTFLRSWPNPSNNQNKKKLTINSSLLQNMHMSSQTGAYQQDLCICGLRPSIRTMVQKVKISSAPMLF
jgi:hypothetical protein